MLSQLLSFMRLSSLSQYLGSETSLSCQEQQPKTSAETDREVSTQHLPTSPGSGKARLFTALPPVGPAEMSKLPLW